MDGYNLRGCAGEDFTVPVLTILHVDPCIGENGAKHRTSRYEAMSRDGDGSRLVVRRGQEFYLHLALSRDYDPDTDGISLVFTVDGADRPQYGHGTLVATPVLYPGQRSEASWQAYIDSLHSNFLRLKVRRSLLSLSTLLSLSLSQIVPAPDAIIGKWRMDIDTKNKSTDGAVSFTMKHPFYLVFNPWCKGRFKGFETLVSRNSSLVLWKSYSARDSEDAVYMEGEDERQEYVMAEDGLIWRGSYNRPRRTVWKYSQFERDILDCALHLMIEVGKVRVSARHDPVIISRVLSAAVSMSLPLSPSPFTKRRGDARPSGWCLLSKGELAGRQRGADG